MRNYQRIIVCSLLFICAACVSGPAKKPLKFSKSQRILANGLPCVPILTYHKFSKKHTDRMTVSEENFKAQMKFLKDHNYRVISLDQLMNFLNFKENAVPPKAVVLTFGNGWRSFYEIAFPVLEKYGYPSTVFLYTDFIGGRKALRWSQIKELHSKGVNMQTQGKTHRDLTCLKSKESLRIYFDALQAEIKSSEKQILKRINKKCTYFSYPYGKTNNIFIEMLEKAGYRAGFTAEHGPNPFYVDNFRINRSSIYGTYGLEEFSKSLEVFQNQTLDSGNPNVNYFQKAVQSFAQKDYKICRQQLLTTLYYKPNHKQALDYLKNKLPRTQDFVIRKTKAGETFKSLAQEIYHDPDKAFLIAYFNETIKPGSSLKIPLLDENFKKEIINIEKQMQSANQHFNKREYKETIKITAEILKYDYLHKKAAQLFNAANFARGQILFKEHKYKKALQVFREVDSDYDRFKKFNLKKQIAKQAALHYGKGVEFYRNQQLEKAIEQWRQTLQLNPQHPKAAKEIKVARRLLKKLKNVK